MGLHNGHNPNAEQSIKDFVNRESISDLDDINSESINTISMISDDMPILLVFIDLDLWKKDKEAAEKSFDEVNAKAKTDQSKNKAKWLERAKGYSYLGKFVIGKNGELAFEGKSAAPKTIGGTQPGGTGGN